MEYDVKWANVHSNSFRVLCGTKQGGILSPDFFSIYINDLIVILKKMGVGCHMLHFFIACLLFRRHVVGRAYSRSIATINQCLCGILFALLFEI